MSGQSRTLSELLRPQQLSDLTLSRPVINRLQQMIDTDAVMHMLFYGNPGVGKTSAARIIMNGLGENGSVEFNGSSVNGVDFVRAKVQSYTMSRSLLAEHRKLCFIDEADYMSKPGQAALRKIIEDHSEVCRFILAVNDGSKLIPALQSRLQRISFDVEPTRRAEVKAAVLERYEIKLTEYGIRFDGRRLVELVGIYFPDFRTIANQIEFEFGAKQKSEQLRAITT
jgi:replication factor C small subunit